MDLDARHPSRRSERGRQTARGEPRRVRRAPAARVLYGTDLGNGDLPVGVNARELAALHARRRPRSGAARRPHRPWPRADRLARRRDVRARASRPPTLDAVPAWLGGATVVPTEELIHDDHVTAVPHARPPTRSPPRPPPSTPPIRSRLAATSSSAPRRRWCTSTATRSAARCARSARTARTVRARAVGRSPHPRVGRVLDGAAVRRSATRSAAPRSGRRRGRPSSATRRPCCCTSSSAPRSTRSTPRTLPAWRSSSTPTTSPPTATSSRASPPSAAAGCAGSRSTVRRASPRTRCERRSVPRRPWSC